MCNPFLFYVYGISLANKNNWYGVLKSHINTGDAYGIIKERIDPA
jgi:hypothetical protein